MKPVRRYAAAIAAIVTSTAGLMAGSGMFAEAANASSTFTGPLNTISTLASTVPANGDVNPYGVAVVPRSTGNLHQGNVLVSNFNDRPNIAGHRHHDRAGHPGRPRVAVRPDRRPGRRLPGRRRPDHRAERAAQRLGDRRLAAHPAAGRQHRHLRLRLPDRAGQPRHGPGDVHRPRHQRPLGHDRSRPGRHRRAVRDQRAERHGRPRAAAGQRRHGAAARDHQPRADAAAAHQHQDRLGLPGDDRTRRALVIGPDRRRPRPRTAPCTSPTR